MSNSTKFVAWRVCMGLFSSLDIACPSVWILHAGRLQYQCWSNVLHCAALALVCARKGCIISVLCVFNNAGEAVGTQLGNLDVSINTSQQSGNRKCVRVSVCGEGRLAFCVGTLYIFCPFHTVCLRTVLGEKSVFKNPTLHKGYTGRHDW